MEITGKRCGEVGLRTLCYSKKCTGGMFGEQMTGCVLIPPSILLPQMVTIFPLVILLRLPTTAY